MKKASAWIKVKVNYTYNSIYKDEYEGAMAEVRDMGAVDFDPDSIEILSVEDNNP